jgi:membrane-bound inhibitor of C-type lysozyme
MRSKETKILIFIMTLTLVFSLFFKFGVDEVRASGEPESSISVIITEDNFPEKKVPVLKELNSFKLEYKDLSPGTKTYYDSKNKENVTITFDAEMKRITAFSSTRAVNYVFVKGGDRGHIYNFNPSINTYVGSKFNINFLVSPRNKGNNTPNVSHVTFYFDDPMPQLRLQKSVSQQNIEAGETVVYTLSIMNNGNVELNNILITDNMLMFEQNLQSLKSGEKYSLDIPYKVSEDADEGELINTAYAITEYKGRTISDSDEASVFISRTSETEDPKDPSENPQPQIKVVKNVNKQKAYAGETLTYTIKVSNTGNVDINNITIKDEMISLNQKINLNAGHDFVITRDYTIPLETEAGVLENIATATAQYEDLTLSSSDSATVVVQIQIIDDDNDNGDVDDDNDNGDVDDDNDNGDVDDDKGDDNQIIDIPEPEVPGGSIPQLGGIPSNFAMGIGSILTLAGLVFIKKRRD